MAGPDGVVAWRVTFLAESLHQAILIHTAFSLPLLLNLKVPCFNILQGASLWMAEAAGAPREGGAAGIWTEREQQWFSFVVVGMDVT